MGGCQAKSTVVTAYVTISSTSAFSLFLSRLSLTDKKCAKFDSNRRAQDHANVSRTALPTQRCVPFAELVLTGSAHCFGRCRKRCPATTFLC